MALESHAARTVIAGAKTGGFGIPPPYIPPCNILAYPKADGSTLLSCLPLDSVKLEKYSNKSEVIVVYNLEAYLSDKATIFLDYCKLENGKLVYRYSSPSPSLSFSRDVVNVVTERLFSASYATEIFAAECKALGIKIVQDPSPLLEAIQRVKAMHDLEHSLPPGPTFTGNTGMIGPVSGFTGPQGATERVENTSS